MAQLLKLRPILKNEVELEEERNLIFDLPRKNCEQLAPEILRLNNKAQSQPPPPPPTSLSSQSQSRQSRNDITKNLLTTATATTITTTTATTNAGGSNNNNANAKVFQHRYHLLKRMLRRARYDNIEKTIVPYLQDLDRSDKIVPHGEVSKRIYMNIYHSRNFDLYGNLRKTVKHPPRKFLELKALAEKKRIEFTQEMDLSMIEIPKLSEEEEELINRRKNIPKLTTEKWKIGREQIHYAPVGFANNPTQPFHSHGNEIFYSYDGNWLKGQMEGYGVYLFADHTKYEGNFHQNRPHGNGESSYKHGQSYQGEYKNGLFDGHGVYTTAEGIKYEGEYFKGKRSGKGKLTFPSGLAYEGEFLDGKPHGRGKMVSKLTGWTWEGQFKEGGISGHGQLIRPPPEFARIIYYWSEKKDPISLPSLIIHYLKEEEDARLKMERAKHEIHAPLRGLLLRDYVNKIRNSYQNDKIQEKLKKIKEATEKIREQKEMLQEARLKALAGEGKGET